MKKDGRVFLTIEQAEARFRAIVDELRKRYADVAELVVDSEEHQVYSIVPNNPNACGFTFIFDQWLDFEAAGGRWELDWTEQGIHLFWQLVTSVAAGRVVAYRGGRRTVTEIVLEAGEVKRSTVSWGISGLLEGRTTVPTAFAAW